MAKSFNRFVAAYILVVILMAAGQSSGTAETIADSATDAETPKTWALPTAPGPQDKQFLDRLEWADHTVGDYVIRTGKIYGKWVAALQFVRKGKLMLTEYTPCAEYITFVDPVSGKKSDGIITTDADKDNQLEICLLHEKLNDPAYRAYTVYALSPGGPRLLWKSAGKLGNWLAGARKPAGQIWSGKTP